MSLLPKFMLTDKLTISRPSSQVRSLRGVMVDGDPTEVVTDAPCRLDKIAVESRQLEGGTRPESREVVYAYLDIDVQFNDFAVITRADGSVVDNRRVKNIDKPGLFRPSHMEIEIEPIGAN